MQAVVAAVFLCAARDSRAASPAAGMEGFYIGTYTSGSSKGIYQASLNLDTGVAGPTNLAGTATNSSFLAMHPGHKLLYAVMDQTAGNVVAFSIDSTKTNLTKLNQLPSNGDNPVYVTVDKAGTSVLTANYNSGSVTVLSILADGSLGSQTAHIQHSSSPTPHAHCVVLDPSNNFALVCDLGQDRIYSYHFDPAQGTLTTNNPPWAPVQTGSGPRHLAFDPQGRRAYVICEVSNTIIAFNYNAQTGVLSPFQTNTTLPAGRLAANNAAAEIVMHPSGKFIYGSNRSNNSSGTNSVVVYSVDPSSGALTMIQQVPTGPSGQKNPRNFALDPTGAFCIVANQYLNNILLFSIDPGTGLLTQKPQTLTFNSPVCVQPFFTQPPQPVLGMPSVVNNTLQIGIGNGCSALIYQFFQAPALTSNPAWTLLSSGACGQTNFILTNNQPQAFLRALVTNY